MPVYVGEDNIDPISIGKVTIAKIYTGDSVLRYEYDPTQVLTLTSQEDFDFGEWLDAQGVDPLRPVIVSLPEGEVIGSTNKNNPAFDMGDISAYEQITFNVNGTIEGAPEGDAMWATQSIELITAGQVAGGIDDGVVLPGPSKITFVVPQGGGILAGGGNGGQGGKGGNGSSNGVWEGWQNIVGSTPGGGVGQWQQRDGFLDYNGARQYTGSGVQNINTVFWVWAGRVYDRGWNYGNGYHEINRAQHFVGVGGSGGLGGQGIGYNVNRTNGGNGAGGTYRSGDGGKGGDGGDWGQNGGHGATGGAGRYFSTTSSGAIRQGKSGSAGTSAGRAIKMIQGTAILYTGNSPEARALGL